MGRSVKPPPSIFSLPHDPAKLPVAMRFDWIKVYRKR
jgi:hypothetical protein